MPGWNYSKSSWIDNSNLEKFSQKYDYTLILPNMKKTLYENKYYRATKLKWHNIPGGIFLKQHFIPHIQKKYALLSHNQFNALLGLSTGGRGVILTALNNPKLFSVAASLSGDYAQEKMPKDRLITAVYGEYSKFPRRWKTVDNPRYLASKWRIPIYLSHGLKDNVVPASQTKLFYKRLNSIHKNKFPIFYKISPNGKHDYKFWNSELKPIFEFFEKVYKTKK